MTLYMLGRQPVAVTSLLFKPGPGQILGLQLVCAVYIVTIFIGNHRMNEQLKTH